jgi:hypothetical protein
MTAPHKMKKDGEDIVIDLPDKDVVFLVIKNGQIDDAIAVHTENDLIETFRHLADLGLINPLTKE